MSVTPILDTLSVNHRHALAFRALRKASDDNPASLIAHALREVVVKAQGCDGFGLVLSVEHLPDHHFNPGHLGEGPGALRPVLSSDGAFAWNGLMTLGQKAVQGTDGLCALILQPAAVEAARQRFRAMRAA